ncbi:MAG: hypothetical protein L6365_20145 [Desulfobulbaceae bacterium]|nr:hypothetical protein [Desulfobulbaceae bacterium]
MTCDVWRQSPLHRGNEKNKPAVLDIDFQFRAMAQAVKDITVLPAALGTLRCVGRRLVVPIMVVLPGNKHVLLKTLGRLAPGNRHRILIVLDPVFWLQEYNLNLRKIRRVYRTTLISHDDPPSEYGSGLVCTDLAAPRASFVKNLGNRKNRDPDLLRFGLWIPVEQDNVVELRTII